ncbi:hypothetical protein niasHT_031563 [Heterodera trifolii]|uniref:Uncharacterized protein n=1 Tax=Heterodera trifolii TaxID=157864 RepID=A0ABD2J6U8_9BILA
MFGRVVNHSMCWCQRFGAIRWASSLSNWTRCRCCCCCSTGPRRGDETKRRRRRQWLARSTSTEQFNNPDNYYDRDGQLISAKGGAVQSKLFTANTVKMCGATTLVALVNGLQLLVRADE